MSGKGGGAGTRSKSDDASSEGGLGGEGGWAGADQGGEPGRGPAPCQRNEDCPNPDHDCRTECRTSPLGNACITIAADHDRDQHGSSACEAAPGDDCDDTRDDVYPGALEVCDARDNDCDGKRDLDDGLHLKGNDHIITYQPTFDVDIAWSAAEMTWGVLWSEASTVMYQPMDTGGNSRIEPVPITDVPSTTARLGSRTAGEPSLNAALPNYPVPHSLAISWGEDGTGTGAFAVAFPGSYVDAVVGLIAADGTPLVAAVPLTDTPDGWGSDSPALQWLPAQGLWAAAWTDLRDNTFEPLVRTVSLTGTLGPEAYPGYGSWPSLALAGGQLAEVWSGFDKPRGALLSSSFDATELDFGDELELKSPFLAARSDRFGVVFSAPPDKIAYAELGLDGALLCGPVLREANGFIQSDIVPVAEGFLILGAQPTVQAIEVLPGCRFGSTIEIHSEPASFVRAGDGGEQGVFVAWGGPDQPLESRVFGPHMCD